ncbi:phage integrase central domain-containing protein [Paraburkholderia caballeronis]|uniref:phage integrase central domain-containing protein n=1 Tax=Paraburkholderia caballeronis TaxID=416943 RepID=UPI003C7BAE04
MRTPARKPAPCVVSSTCVTVSAKPPAFPLPRSSSRRPRAPCDDLKPGQRNDQHSAQWISALETYVFPKLGAKRLDVITPADCADVLRPIWLEIPVARQRMHALMQWVWTHCHTTANR